MGIGEGPTGVSAPLRSLLPEVAVFVRVLVDFGVERPAPEFAVACKPHVGMTGDVFHQLLEHGPIKSVTDDKPVVTEDPDIAGTTDRRTFGIEIDRNWP